MASYLQLGLIVLMLMFSQYIQSLAYPTAPATSLDPKDPAIETTISHLESGAVTTQYPPTTVVPITVPGTVGVS